MSSFSFEAVLFDLDGTLVATDRYWPDAARGAALRFLGERGIERPLPSTADWMAMVGRPLDEAFDEAFADLDRGVRRELMDDCLAEERGLVARGAAALLGGVTEALGDLRGRGVRLGVASNCGHDYLDTMLFGLGLSEWIEEGRCLRMPGIANKADMIADLLLTFDTRSAVMVGDRSGDRDAAWANGLPYVHVPRGYGGMREPVAAEASLDGMDELLPRLVDRDTRLTEVLQRVAGADRIGVTGMPRSGKTLLCRDLVRLAGDRAPQVLDDPKGAALEGCDRLVRVIADEPVLVRRAQGERVGPAPVEELLSSRLPAYRAEAERAPAPDLVVDLSNPIAPTVCAGAAG